MGLIRPQEGEITIDRKSFTNQDQIIGYVAQDTFLFNQTIRNNLLLSQPHATDKELINALNQAEAYHYVSQLPKGLDTTIGERGVKLFRRRKTTTSNSSSSYKKAIPTHTRRSNQQPRHRKRKTHHKDYR